MYFKFCYKYKYCIQICFKCLNLITDDLQAYYLKEDAKQRGIINGLKIITAFMFNGEILYVTKFQLLV